jgi:shikimate kinase
VTTPRVVLIGPPGSGKTTVGRLLADALGVAFRDTDLDVEEVAGKPVGEIFIDDGEEHFRALEHDAVRSALTGHDGVLALGGGAVMEEATRELLAGHTIVYLRVGLSDAVQRVGLAQARPLLVFNPRSQLRKLMEERRPLYEGLASFTADTDGRDPADITAEIVKALA